MTRAVTLSLIVLVGLMAFVPQALCPCAVRARAVAAAPTQGEPLPLRPCCARHVRRPSAPVAQREAPPPAPLPEPCPCCNVNGQGRLLLTMGESVRPEPLAVVATVPPPPAPAPVARVAEAVAAVALPPSVAPPPLHEHLASVVLLI